MAEWFVGPIMETLIDTCYEYLQDQVRWQTGMKKELKRLRENHPKIQAVVSAASQTHMIGPTSALSKWIWQLRDAIDEADDVLDDFEYMKHKEQLARNMVRSTMCSLKKIGKGAFKIDSNLKRLQKIVQKLDKISAEVSTFLHLLDNTKQELQVQQDELQKYRQTGSLPKHDLIGRGKDKEFVIQWLRKSPNEEHRSHVTAIPRYNNISLLPIVGHGGLGKTTLLQHVYEDEMTKEFNLKIWVCVSNNFDVKKVLIDMLESLKKTRPSLESLDTLQNSLKSEVMSQKFLLVLDDIWEENEERDKSKWEDVLAPLAHGGLGSKILITTRMNSAASMIAKVINKKNEALILEGLKEDECLQLLNTHAFADIENPNVHKKLRSITEELVKKLYGSPLAAKVIGGVLNFSLDERYWTNVLNNVLSYNEIFPILKLSYIFLPKNLQNCFAFCSIFPQDHIFDKDDLIRMWIAVGFIQPSNNRGEDVEDIGRRYIDILVKKSFFDKVKRGYKMHDLLHELAQFVSKQECSRVMGGEELLSKIPETIRHLSVETSKLELLKKMGKFKNLRTLCITYHYQYNQDFVNVLTNILKVSRGIRLLSINAYYEEMIPETIGCLKHLRYVKLNFPTVTSLPRSVSNLHHLQFLICENVSNDDFFPRDMNNLSNLRFLRTRHYKFPGIGKLKFLEELNGFLVKNETGYRIGELKHMNDLRILGIEGLENVRDAQEACNAKLSDKRKLADLSLDWKITDIHAMLKDSSLEWEETSQNITDLDIYARVLDNLQPHNNLKKMRMSNYMGARSAIWMNNADLINNLVEIELHGCLEWQILPPFGQLPFLKSLRLRDMPKAERFDNKFHGNGMRCGFPSLEVLYIANLEALEDWFDTGVDCLFPCLTELKLYDCPNLQELPYLPPKLEILKANRIGWKTLNCCSIQESIPLNRLAVFDCPNITDIYLIGSPAAKRDVELIDCPNLLSLGGHQEVETTENCPNLIVNCLTISDPSVLQMEPLRSVASIEVLMINDNDGLLSLPFEAERWFLQVSSSLLYLTFKNLKSLQSLPSFLTSLSPLKKLRLANIPLLKSLPDLPPSLRELYLDNLDNLNCLPSCLPTHSSLEELSISKVPLLRELPDLPPSLCRLKLEYLDNLNCLPSRSSLTYLSIEKVPQLRELPDLPTTLCRLSLCNLDNLNCLSSCLSRLSSLTVLSIDNVPRLRELPDLPPSLRYLNLKNLDNLNCLPSCLPSLSSLTYLTISKAPQLRELPDLPPSLKTLDITKM